MDAHFALAFHRLYFLFPVLFLLGLFLIIISVRVVIKIADDKPVFSLPFRDERGTFRIEKPGSYAVYQEKEILSKAPVDRFRSVIINNETKEPVQLHPSILRPHSSGFSRVKIQLFTFHAPCGKYTLSITPGRSISRAEEVLIKPVAAVLPETDYNDYKLLICHGFPYVKMFISVWGIVIGALIFLSSIILLLQK